MRLGFRNWTNYKGRNIKGQKNLCKEKLQNTKISNLNKTVLCCSKDEYKWQVITCVGITCTWNLNRKSSI